MTHKQFIVPLIVVLAAIYPIIVFLGINHFRPRSLALMLLGIVVLRLVFLGSQANKEHYLQFIAVALLCLAAVWLDSEALLRYYPVLMNFSFAILFMSSLASDQPLIERFARFRHSDLQDHQISYMRGLTKAWAILLVLNGTVAYYTACCLSLKQWALYNGLIAYCVFALFTGIELIYRSRYKSRHAQSETAN